MLSQENLERERHLARIKVERDELSRLQSAREEGFEEGFKEGFERGLLIGTVLVYQEWLGQPLTAAATLRELPLEKLQQLALQLKQHVTK